MNLLALLSSGFSSFHEKNRHRHKRFRRVTLLTIQPLDDDLSKSGTQFWAMSRDISETGIDFLCQKRITCNYLRVTVIDDGSSAIAIVRHCRMLDESSFGYCIGVELLDDYSCHDRARC